jgi:hypothetical protein
MVRPKPWMVLGGKIAGWGSYHPHPGVGVQHPAIGEIFFRTLLFSLLKSNIDKILSQ